MTVEPEFVEKDFITQEMYWLLDTIYWRWEKEFDKKDVPNEFPSPAVQKENSRYEYLIDRLNLNEDQRLVLALSLANFFIRAMLSRYVSIGLNYDPITYGVRNKFDPYFMPTGTTALFLLYGNDFTKRVKGVTHFMKHPLVQKKCIFLDDQKAHEPALSGYLCVSVSLIKYLSEQITFEELVKNQKTDING